MINLKEKVEALKLWAVGVWEQAIEPYNIQVILKNLESVTNQLAFELIEKERLQAHIKKLKEENKELKSKVSQAERRIDTEISYKNMYSTMHDKLLVGLEILIAENSTKEK